MTCNCSVVAPSDYQIEFEFLDSVYLLHVGMRCQNASRNWSQVVQGLSRRSALREIPFVDRFAAVE